MRGKDRYEKIICSRDRITPAYAGKSFSDADRMLFVQDHPRLCGEKFLYHSLRRRHEGSPPPMRGKEKAGQAFRCGNRITPAYAGKSRCHCRWHTGFRDHPRLCGEKDRNHSQQGAKRGSPPPMRGKEESFAINLCGSGITPAYAGKRQLLLDLNATW